MELEHIFRPSLIALADYRSSYVPPRPGEIYSNLNEAADELPDPVKDEIVARLRALDLHRYPDPSSRDLVAKIARRDGVPPECVLPVCGVNDAIAKVLSAMHPESAFVTCPPTYYLYERLARLHGLEVKNVSLDEDFRVKGGEVLVAAYEVHRCLTILANPNNPTGRLVDEEQLGLITGQFPGLIAIDEAYYDFTGVTVAPEVQSHPGLIVMRTFSKAFSFAAGRIGYVLADPEIIRQLAKTVVPYSIPQTSQAIASVLLEHEDVVRERARQIVVERDRLAGRLARHPRLAPIPSSANFFLVRLVGGDSRPRALLDALAARGVHLRDVSHLPLLADCFRITVARPDENDRIATAVEEALAALP